jgi:hypothetical protein
MATPPLKLTRDQLATFLKDQRQIRAFENLFDIAEEADVEGIAQVALQAGTANSRAQQALDTLQRLADLLDLLLNKPEIQHHNGVRADYIDLPIAGPHVTLPRRVQWNEDDGTIDVGLYGGSVLQVGQEIMYYAKNTSGGTILNGTPVMFSGTVGASGKLTFAKAVADGSVPSEYMMGVATQDIDNNAFGYVTSFGLVRGFDTTGTPYGETWADGDLLYFDPATAGTWTKVKPAAPNIRHPVAVVINAGSGGSGSIFVRMQVEESLEDLQDVQVTSPTNEQIIKYNSSNGRWENSGSITATLTDNSADLIKSSATLSDGAGAGAGTLTNAPTAGDPTKWVAIDDNGTTRYIPAW